MKREKIRNILLLICLIIFSVTIVKKTFQNDTFFTIALGENILENGIDTQEKLVWHEGLENTNPRWLFELLIAGIHNLFDFFGIYVFVMIMACLQMIFYYYIINKITGKKIISFLYTLFVVHLLRNQFVARAQLMSFPLFLLEFYSIEELLRTNKKRYYIYLSIIPFLLVCFHTPVYLFYFIMFVPYIMESILSKIFVKDEKSKFILEKNKILKLIIFFVIGIVAVFATRKGIEPIIYIFKNQEGISSNFILELQPVCIYSASIEITMFSFVIAIIAFTKTKVRITDCFFIIGFLLLGLTVVRSIFFYYLISTICIIRIINDFLNDYNIDLKVNNKKVKIAIFSILSIYLITFVMYNFSNNYTSEYVDEKSYPVKATEYILDNIDISKMRIYNHFNFGSYLELRGIKTFMDSRSELFTKQFNKDCTILDDWYNTIKGIVDYKETFEKYDITHAILYKTELINLYIDDDPNWQKIYEDENFVLYEKI